VPKDIDSMTKYKHMMTVEESVMNFINLLEEDSETKISEEDKEWLFTKGENLFNAYYVDMQVTVYLGSEKDNESLNDYFGKVQDSLGSMFAHIMLVEFKLHLLEKEFGIKE